LFWGQVIAFAGSLPFLAIDHFRVEAMRAYTLTTWLSLLFLGTVFYSWTVMIFFKILVRLDAGQIMIFAYLQPVSGVVMAAILLHERVTASVMLGGLLVVAGTLVVAFERPARVEVGQTAGG
jgi:drug/metabolite transporter (DMT)-like permease